VLEHEESADAGVEVAVVMSPAVSSADAVIIDIFFKFIAFFPSPRFAVRSVVLLGKYPLIDLPEPGSTAWNLE